MPRKSRVDTPGALQHVRARGIDRQRIFLDIPDKKNFLDRLSGLLRDSETQCHAWAALDNHFYLLLRTGTVPISTMNGRIRILFWVDSERGFRRPGPRERPSAA